MFGRKKIKIPVNRSDLKKAIVSANNKLQRSNVNLEKNIGIKKDSLASIGKEILSNNKELKSILSQIKSRKEDINKYQAEGKKKNAMLSRYKKQITEALTARDGAQSIFNNLTKESKILENKVSKMNDDLAKVVSIKNEVKLLMSDKKAQSKALEQITGEFNGIKEELSKLRTESIEKKEGHKKLLNSLNEETDEIRKALGTVDSEYQIKIAEYNTKISSLKDFMEEQRGEANIIESLVKKVEQDYIEMETRRKQAENELMYAKEATDKEIERAKTEVENIKKAYGKWKIAALEDVARLTLKKKIENIDKAGLADILNG